MKEISPRTYRWTSFGLIAIGIVGIGISATAMGRLALWEHWPLWLFLSIYFLVVGGIIAYKAQREKPLQGKHILATFLSGLALALSFPPYGLLPFAFLAFICLLYLDHKRRNYEISGRTFFWLSFNFFVVWNIFATFWVANSALSAGIVAIVLNSLLMTLPISIASWLRRTLNIKPYYGIIWVATWLVFELLHLRWDISWPWLTLGNTLASAPLLAQWYEYTGVLGGSLWFLGGNFIIYQLFYLKVIGRQKIAVSQLLPITIWLFIPLISSFWIFSQNENSTHTAKVSVINGNFEPHYEKFTESEAQKISTFDSLINIALKEKPDFILLPETSFDRIYLNNLEDQSGIHFLKRKVEQSRGDAALISGVTSIKVFDRSQKIPERSSIRTATNAAGEIYYWEVYNSAVMLDEDKIEVYHKQKLVPGAEIFPYRHLLFFFKPIIDQLGGSIFGYGRPKSQNIFSFQNINLGPVICYESIYGDFCRKYVHEGANVLGIITNDGWWGNTAGYKQHYAFARLRAIELRRSVVRSANLGRCGFFDPNGLDLVEPNAYDQATVLTQVVPIHTQLTFYAKWGDYIGRFSLFLMIFVLLKGIVEALKRRSPIQ